MEVGVQVACLSSLSPPLVPVVLALSLILFFLIGYSPRERWSLRHIPGPWSLPFLGHLPVMAAKDITHFLYEVAQKYGPVAQVWLGARPWVVVSDPELIRKVAYKSVARPASSNSFTHMLVGEPDEVDAEITLWNRGPSWKAARRAFESSVMHPDKLRAHVPAIRRCLDRFVGSHLKRWADSGEALEMKKAFGVVSLAVAGEVAYGVDFWTEDAGNSEPVAAEAAAKTGDAAGQKAAVAELVQASYEIFKCMELPHATAYLPLQMMLPSFRPLWLWLAERFPDAAQRRHMRARQKVADVSRRLMQQWQAARAAAGNGQPNGHAAEADSGFRETSSGGISSSSFLAAMLEDRKQQEKQRAGGDDSGLLDVPRMNDIQVIASGLTFMLASYDTTSTTLANAVFCLASHPSIQERLRAEVASLPSGLEDMEAVGKLPFLDAVVKESQRLYPVGTFAWRELQADLDLGNGMTLPKSAFVCMSYYNIAKDPHQWREPERFLPERFLPETKGALGPADPNALLPFGIGARMCVGYKLATLVVKASLAALLLRYKLELHPRQRLPLRLKTSIVLSPVDGVWVTLSEVK